jgi:hypothetical protein
MKSYIKQLLREALLDEEVVNGKYYHGSQFPKIEWGLADEDYNKALFGYGIYVTTNSDEAMDYALEGKDTGYLHSMSIKGLNIVEFDDESVSNEIKTKLESIPNFYDLFKVGFNYEDYNFEDYVYHIGDIIYEWDFFDEESAKFNEIPQGYSVSKFVDDELVDEVYGLNEDEIPQTIINFNDFYYINELDYLDADIILHKDTLFNDYRYIYFYVCKKLNSFKEGSKLFANLGIDGFKAKGFSTDWFELSSSDYIVNIINPSKLKNIRTKVVTPKDKISYMK